MLTTYLDQATFGPWTDLASASTADLGSIQSNCVNITGTTTITSFGTGVSLLRFVKFAAALTLTHNATSLILPGAANITTAAGDSCTCLSDGSGNWKVVIYTRANGVSLGVPQSTTAGTLPYFSGTDGKIAAMTGMAWDNTNTSLVLTGNTVTTSKPLFDASQTWNSGATSFTAFRINAFASSYASPSYVFDFMVSSVSKFKMDPSGNVAITGGSFQIGGTTSSFPALNNSGTTLRARLADNSADAPFSASTFTASSYFISQASLGYVYQFGNIYFRVNSVGVKMGSLTPLVWTQSSDSNDTADVGLSRNGAAGKLALGTGAAGNTSGELIAANARYAPTRPTQITADQNNYAPSSPTRLLYLSSDAARTLTGISISQSDGHPYEIWNVGSNNIVLANESASSTAANRFQTTTGADITLAAKQMAFLRYDSTQSRWLVTKGN